MRETLIVPNGPAVLIDVVRDERHLVLVEGMGSADLTLAISDTAGGEPLIEIPGVGEFDLAPVVVQALLEGKRYFYNIWTLSITDYERIAAGEIVTSASIAPTGVDAATTFLSGFGQTGGPDRLVVMSQATYDALGSPDPDTLYIIVG